MPVSGAVGIADQCAVNDRIKPAHVSPLLLQQIIPGPPADAVRIQRLRCGKDQISGDEDLLPPRSFAELAGVKAGIRNTELSVQKAQNGHIMPAVGLQYILDNRKKDMRDRVS